MHCPKCRTEELSTRRSKDSDVAVDWCAECRGVWFDAGELAAALTVATKDLTVPRKAQKIGLLCPKCEKSLYSFHYPQTLVTIDMCKKCKGLWLNSGEFKEIKAVRRSLKRQGAVEEYAPVGGVKGSFLRYIDQVLGTIGTR